MRGTFTAEGDSPLLSFLFEKLPEVKRTKVRQWLKFNGVQVNGRVVAKATHALHAGDVVTLEPKAKAAPATGLPPGMRIIHEDASVIVIEKPAGLLSIATDKEQEATAYAKLTDYVRRTPKTREARIWIVHRLDRETSGLMVFARTEDAKRSLQTGWDLVEKRYLAVVDGIPKEPRGTLRSHLDETDSFRVRSTSQSENTREAVTHYRLMRKAAHRSLVELILETGRRHQIRVQLAEIGCPIVGDPKYHPGKATGKRMALHASSLKFFHPETGVVMSFKSALPGEIGSMMEPGK